jgi:hypothetical protein
MDASLVVYFDGTLMLSESVRPNASGREQLAGFDLARLQAETPPF